ncbi:hypothetical protein PRIPAC_93762 [Pristionchus pacificus]|uniref:Uncharacterized protein n=1 Tax=Pristionchus pacificus TaxID=54126 RepID=A0A2A6BPF9_PRIPA|nr:hypothetical protein PRIPAC_93762 [Pristionchus pacificus]|eukprot:PDM67790.1 hypothetical protein PRIPAC_45834 [Pristionchus pacificus]
MSPHSAQSLMMPNCERDAKLIEQSLHLLFAIKLLIESINKETETSFADLPDDIVRNIISLSGDPYSLRLISPKWNYLVLEYTTSRILVIDRLEVRVGADDELSIKIRLPMKWHGYFNSRAIVTV